MIIVAGGDSTRFGGDKLMTPIAGQPLIVHTVAAVSGSADVCVLVCRQDQSEDLIGALGDVIVVAGGPTRTQSEMAGLAALPDEIALIGIHDGARPLVSRPLIELLFETAAKVGGAVPVLEPSRPLVRRSNLGPVPAAVAQTPQVFRGPALQAAYRMAAAHGSRPRRVMWTEMCCVRSRYSELPEKTGGIGRPSRSSRVGAMSACEACPTRARREPGRLSQISSGTRMPSL